MAESDSMQIVVWVVEDNNHFRKSVVSLVNRTEGMICEHAFASCEQALTMLETGSLPDILLLDIGLSGMSGIEGIAKFKSMIPTTQIIMLTMHEDDKKVFEAISAGAMGYLLKSSPPENIIRGIQEVIDGGSAINPLIARKVLEQFTRAAASHSEYGLTRREKEILALFVDGLRKQEIADKLFLSFHTVNAHIKNIYNKLQVNTRGQLMAKAHKERIV